MATASEQYEALRTRVEQLAERLRDDKERIDRLTRDLEMQAKTITEIVVFQRGLSEELTELEQKYGIRDIKDGYRDDATKRTKHFVTLAVGSIITVSIAAGLAFVFNKIGIVL